MGFKTSAALSPGDAVLLPETIIDSLEHEKKSKAIKLNSRIDLFS
jgi:hypothetical protein